MRTLPERISFEPFSFLQITRKRNKDVLEFLLVEFQINVPIPSVHAYLLTKALKSQNLKEEIEGLTEAFNVVDYSPELMERMAELEGALIRDNVFVSFDDLLVASSAIITDSLLVVDNDVIDNYKPFIKYGLKVISYSKFLEKVETLAREEERKIGGL